MRHAYLEVDGELQDFSVSPSPFGTNKGFDLGCTGLGLYLGGLRTKGLGTGLDNNNNDVVVVGTGAEYSGEADLLEYTVGDIAIDNLSNNTESDYGEVMVGANNGFVLCK